MLKVLTQKLHAIQVTGADLEYEGSIVLDSVFCEKLGMIPFQFVDIWNINNGKRISTYVLPGARDSRCCILNGSAARSCHPGDRIIIAASRYVSQEEALSIRPKVLCFGPGNTIKQFLEYRITDPNHPFEIASVQI